MDIQSLYDSKSTSAAGAVANINSGDNLILGMGVAMPPALITACASAIRDNQLHNIALYYMHGSETLAEQLLNPDILPRIHARPLFMSAHDRQAFQNQLSTSMQSGSIKCSSMEFVPATFHQVGRLLTEQISPDHFLVTVSPMDKHGYFSLGTNADYGASVIRKAKRVIVEVNQYMPRTFGECSVHISEVDAIIEHHQPLTEILPHTGNETDRMIAEKIVDRIDDGDTLQLGVGGVPNAVLGFLNDHKNLGLHSELFSPAMVELIKKGVINGRLKNWMQHKHVFTLALGDKAMYDFMDDNPSIVGYPASWVNNPNIIRKNKNMVSVNAAIEVDLSGQINAEQLDGQPFSGTGGQLDFVRGAYASQGGRSFIALHSTAKQGSISRIVPQIQSGAITDTRMDTHFVVTEYGCVNLKGLSLPQRAKALISIAHPDFRNELDKQAQHLGYL